MSAMFERVEEYGQGPMGPEPLKTRTTVGRSVAFILMALILAWTVNALASNPRVLGGSFECKAFKFEIRLDDAQAGGCPKPVAMDRGDKVR